MSRLVLRYRYLPIRTRVLTEYEATWLGAQTLVVRMHTPGVSMQCSMGMLGLQGLVRCGMWGGIYMGDGAHVPNSVAKRIIQIILCTMLPTADLWQG